MLQLIYGEAISTPYVLDPEVLSDTRIVSFRYKNARAFASLHGRFSPTWATPWSARAVWTGAQA